MPKTQAVPPRPEYPRPQFQRADWLNLNGHWDFEIDPDDSGLERGLLNRPLSGEIVVPFVPESALSGVGTTEFMAAVWYRKRVRVPPAWSGKVLQLHFGAVDHDATVWVDGTEVARHRGGYTSFTADLGLVDRLGPRITITVRARDSHDGPQARGKQSPLAEPAWAFCMRSTGIWQTVWLEPVPMAHLTRPRITPLAALDGFLIETAVRGAGAGLAVRICLSMCGTPVALGEVVVGLDFGAAVFLPVPADRRRVWCIGDPFLYDLTVELVAEDGSLVDSVVSYAGLRSVAIDRKAILINGVPVFQRLVADQGYYPDGIYTAPTDADLIRDIELAMSAGFNGARLHQKVFEERYLYHCDRLGYLVWSEFPDWGVHDPTGAASGSVVAEWMEALERDYSHPAIIGWCPLNEVLQVPEDSITVLDDLTRALFLATKGLDRTRPVIDVSGYSHRVSLTDVYDVHNYEQDPDVYAQQMTKGWPASPFVNGQDGDELRTLGLTDRPLSVPYTGQPYFNSEWGGILWAPEVDDDQILSGYELPGATGSLMREIFAPRLVHSAEEFYARFEALAQVMLDDPNQFGYCYFELTDTYRELLGIYRFDRSEKLDPTRLHAIQSRPAAIEERDAGPSGWVAPAVTQIWNRSTAGSSEPADA